MKVLIPTASKDGSTQAIAIAPARHADALGADLSVLPALEAQDLPGRPLSLAYMPLLGLLATEMTRADRGPRKTR